MTLQIQAVAPFKPAGEPSSIAQRWTRWRKSFEYFLIASGVTNRPRKRALLQQVNESVEQYVTRLRTLTLHCEYTDRNDQIRDHFIASCDSTKLRKRLLTEPALTLEKILDIGQARESAQVHCKQIESDNTPSSASEVNQLRQQLRSFQRNGRQYQNRKQHDQNQKQHNQNKKKTSSCTKCGAKAHSGRECRRSKNAKCYSCGKIGHFKSVCRSKVQQH